MNAPSAPKRRRRPVRGAISGLLFGLFLGVDLLLLGVVRSDSVVLLILPLLGLVGGVAIGLTTPFGRRSPSQPPSPSPSPLPGE